MTIKAEGQSLPGQRYRNQTAAAYSFLYFFIFLSLHFSNTKHFRHTFLKNCDAYEFETWYTWTIGGCNVYTGIRQLLLICPFISLSLFFFLSSFGTLKFFITFFTGTGRPTKLKISMHVNSGWMHHVYWNQTAAAYSFLYFFIFLSLHFSNIKHFRHTFLKNYDAYEVETWYTCGQWVDVLCIPESGSCCCLFVPLLLHFSFSPILKH